MISKKRIARLVNKIEKVHSERIKSKLIIKSKEGLFQFILGKQLYDYKLQCIPVSEYSKECEVIDFSRYLINDIIVALGPDINSSTFIIDDIE
ncbi:hypothetical protein FDA33_14655 [Clostridium botulinum]|nr:hypothetical protein [Clostridium botulinum]NFI19331.1 hypothetical protein [Clostridium botulinum]NFL94731.1 hypothetical protein [Clostridium botulinum]NFN52901.1 hypothetical protein [Clostridium botulinum]NFO27461.1 hypothetical protein [Clostridium botulinum]